VYGEVGTHCDKVIQYIFAIALVIALVAGDKGISLADLGARARARAMTAEFD
jgi:hypothetical protein